ncbi:MAG: RagB/SusD family nutrient uptake outer membrane protein [Psychroflexus halocasei]|uniref:RagB/SusD family nutrient uptake outer membrane protein n=1 Tax=Psychroflexus sp. S27 TaxID=1982757 RepID=UPI000C2A9998|nr:RagB/SusD family nutrient uptake outer membrane protein [Psychroflexus sp. S27]PJX28491.1 hypothetical protein CAP47_00410 [Psychroflexus sp. S27]
MDTFKYTFLLFILAICSSCEDFVEVDLPDHKVTRETVFNNDKIARSAMTGIYNQLFNTSYANGGNHSVTFLAGISSDNFKLTTNNEDMREFNQNNITALNNYNLELWAGAYNIIYMTNSLLEGLENSESISDENRKSLEGEAKFVRAFTYFYLTNLYNEVPLILGTDYRINATASQNQQADIIEKIIDDLLDALDLLDENYLENNRARPNKAAANALLAKVYLYVEDWEKAENYSDKLISQASLYELLGHEEVFLANSREAIWQISPIGWGSTLTHTREGSIFIYDPTMNTPVIFSNDFMEIWGTSPDLRYDKWIGEYTQEGVSSYYSYKYKIAFDFSGAEIEEYSMVMRLAEQYLIRAEARAQQNKLQGAIADVDMIKQRAGLPLLSVTQPNISQQALLEEILLERRKELFAEWGHRWFDLQRFDQTSILNDKPNTVWQPEHRWFPIPENEILKNPKLNQNDAY